MRHNDDTSSESNGGLGGSSDSIVLIPFVRRTPNLDEKRGRSSAETESVDGGTESIDGGTESIDGVIRVGVEAGVDGSRSYRENPEWFCVSAAGL